LTEISAALVVKHRASHPDEIPEVGRVLKISTVHPPTPVFGRKTWMRPLWSLDVDELVLAHVAVCGELRPASRDYAPFDVAGARGLGTRLRGCELVLNGIDALGPAAPQLFPCAV